MEKKIIVYIIYIYVLDWEVFVEFFFDDILCIGILFNNFKGVYYKLLINNFKNNMLLMLFKYLVVIFEIFRFYFKCIVIVNIFNIRILYF